MRIRTRSQWGFTLVEIMIVVAIIGLLASIAMPKFVRAREESRTKRCINALRQISGAKEQYALELGLPNGEPCDMSLIEDYLKAVPTCPVGDTDYLVNDIGDEPECNSSSALAHNSAWITP